MLRKEWDRGTLPPSQGHYQEASMLRQACDVSLLTYDITEASMKAGDMGWRVIILHFMHGMLARKMSAL